MAENHVVAVGEPAQQLAGLFAGLAVELAGVLGELVGEHAHAAIHRRGVLDRVVHVVEHAAQVAGQHVVLVGRDVVEFDVHPRLDDRVLGHRRVVVDVEDLGQPAVRITLHDDLRVQHPLGRTAAALQLGTQRVDEVRDVAGDDVDRGGVGVEVGDPQERLAVATLRTELEVAGGKSGEPVLVPAGQLARGMRKVAADEDVGVDAAS